MFVSVPLCACACVAHLHPSHDRELAHVQVHRGGGRGPDLIDDALVGGIRELNEIGSDPVGCKGSSCEAFIVRGVQWDFGESNGCAVEELSV